MKKAVCIFVLFVSVMTGVVNANNVTITNLAITGVTATTAELQFDLSWDNSWRQSWTDYSVNQPVENWDAVWVFAKYRLPGAPWRHVLLTDTDHTATGGSIIEIGTSQGPINVGAFVYRSGAGSGTMNCSAMKLKWDLAQNGLSGTNDIDVSVHAIEMVYIPEGAYYLGSGGTEYGRFYEYPDMSAPYYVTNASPIPCGTAAGNLYAHNYQPVNLPAEFPNGYSGIYCMKYEITQGQYASYLSLLEEVRGYSLTTPIMYNQSRYTIRLMPDGNYSADAPDRACNYLSWNDLMAYLDWAGLRPMTEFEYEKICRGIHLPEPNEFAWGDVRQDFMTSYSGTYGSGTETAYPAIANCCDNSYPYKSPVRAGLFAESGSSRHKSGAAYYGVMEMTGNVYEQTVPATSHGFGFVPVHGDGNPYTDVSGWDGITAYLHRGGDGSGSSVSYRYLLRTSSYFDSRYNTGGGRGVRNRP